jgi:hypothetical protein
MAIRNNMTREEVNAIFLERKKKVELAIFTRLSRIGEKLLTYAKTIPADKGYNDRTGNLRSSTGYIIVMDGRIAKNKFSKVTGSEQSTEDGASIGLTYAESLAANHSKGYVLIFVAGMEYALEVESRGKDVLTTTEYKARSEMPAELKELENNIKTMRL